MDTEAVIRLDDVCFSYGRQEVLHNISFGLDMGRMVGVVGPNGGGKTTLLRLILGILVPRLGTVEIFGAGPTQARGRLGYVPQHFEFDMRFPVTVRDVVQMGRLERHSWGPYRRADRAAAEHALEQVGLKEHVRATFADLSGGERQRVLVAQALAGEPDILLMDEPTANVDSRAEHALFELFHELNHGRIIVLVSHNLTVVTRHVTDVLCVNRTAELRKIESMTAAVFQEAYGGDLALLEHGVTCHVIDSSGVMNSPHSGEHHHGHTHEGSQ